MLKMPMELGWEAFSKQTLDAAAASGRPVIFDLTHMQDIPGILSGTGRFAITVTGAELRFHLIGAGAARPLGAERLRYVAARLVSLLSDASPGLRWVFSLSELHYSAYGEDVGSESILHIQDSGGSMVSKVVLTPAEKRGRIEELSRLTKA